MNEQVAIMQGLWLQANASTEAIPIDCGSVSDARRFRLAMYAAVADAKKPGGVASSALREAAANCQLSFSEDKKTIIVQRKTLSRVMVAAAAALRPEFKLAKSDEEAQIEEMGKRLFEKLDEGQAKPDEAGGQSKNPYAGAMRHG